jgi:hypothetical protein
MPAMGSSEYFDAPNIEDQRAAIAATVNSIPALLPSNATREIFATGVLATTNDETATYKQGGWSFEGAAEDVVREGVHGELIFLGEELAAAGAADYQHLIQLAHESRIHYRVISGDDVVVRVNGELVDPGRPVSVPSFSNIPFRVEGTTTEGDIVDGRHVVAIELTVEPTDEARPNVSSVSIIDSVYSNDPRISWTDNDKRTLRIARAFSDWLISEGEAHIAEGLSISGVPLVDVNNINTSNRVFESSAWIHGVWGGSALAAKATFRTFLARVRMAVQVAVLSCLSGAMLLDS